MQWYQNQWNRRYTDAHIVALRCIFACCCQKFTQLVISMLYSNHIQRALYWIVSIHPKKQNSVHKSNIFSQYIISLMRMYLFRPCHNLFVHVLYILVGLFICLFACVFVYSFIPFVCFVLFTTFTVDIPLEESRLIGSIPFGRVQTKDWKWLR